MLYVVLQFATAAILTLAANTAYADFPRLSSIIAHDGYLPRQLANRGDRLVFSNGVLVLAAAAGALLIAFGGITNALIPLYAVGVFTVVHAVARPAWCATTRRSARAGWQAQHRRSTRSAPPRRSSCCSSSAPRSSRAARGCPLVVIPLIVVLFKAIKRHYQTGRRRARASPPTTSRAG